MGSGTEAGDATNSLSGGSSALSPAPGPLPNIGAAVNEQDKGEPFGPTTGISSPIPIPKKQAEWESGYQNEHGPRPSRWEAWAQEPFKEGLHGTIGSPGALGFGALGVLINGGLDSPQGALERLYQGKQAETGTMLSPDQANKLYPGRPVPYTTPVDQGTALMEYNDRQKMQDMSDWVAQRPQTNMGRVVSTAFGFVGGLTDPLNFAIGMMSGGVSEMLAPEASGVAGKVAAHYLGNLGGFSATDAAQNLLEHQMGAKQKQLSQIVGESVVPAAVMTGIGVGLSAVARRWTNEAGGTSEADVAGVKKTVAALEQDQRAPQLEDQRAVIAERKAGVSHPEGPNSEKVMPTLLTSPLKETPLYVAAHADGTPLIHEHGLGPGAQFTDSYEVANNGVSRSTETPGQIGETGLPESTKLLNIDRSAAEDYAQKDSFLKAVEEKTGVPLDAAIKSGESLKDIITNLGDWAGADIGEGKNIPEDILKQIQAIAKEMGFTGYEFQNDAATARQVHLFDTSGLELHKSYSADPSKTPEFPAPKGSEPQVEGAQPAQLENPAMDKAQSKFYSPELEKLAHEFRKGKTFDPYSPEAVAETEKEIEQYKKQLADLAKESPSAEAALEDLRAQEAQDKRLRDIAKRIAECGDGGGV